MNKNLAQKTRELLNRYELRPKKKYGQNFLLDHGIIDGILAAARVTPQDTVVEIGPGLGSLTKALAAKAGGVLAVEIDGDLIFPLREILAPYPNCRLLHGDILSLNLDEEVAAAFPRASFPYKVVANLPYYITTPIIMGLLEQKCRCQAMILMVQKEVGERMQAKPGTKAYGALSVAVQYYAEPELVLKVPPSAFKPAPAVDSVVIRLQVRKEPAVRTKDEALFFRVVRGAFGQRRKTLTNALANALPGLDKSQLTALLQAINIDPQIRGEALGLTEFALIADALAAKGGN